MRPQGVIRKSDSDVLPVNKMKIIGGAMKGMKIFSPPVYLRPMMAKAREALFNSLDHLNIITADTRVLDLFAGSGSVGLEAMSRGAVHCTFVDLSDICISTIKTNTQHCRFPESACSYVCGRVEDALTTPQQFGLVQPYQFVTITPPYKEVNYSQLIDLVSQTTLVEDDTVIVVEYPQEMGTLPHVIGNQRLFGLRNRKYGRTVLATYVYRPTMTYDMHSSEFGGLV